MPRGHSRSTRIRVPSPASGLSYTRFTASVVIGSIFGHIHVSTNNVYAYSHERSKATSKDPARRRERPGRTVRRLEQPPRRAAHYPVSRSSDGGKRPDRGAARPDGADRRDRG